jgi:hypothetical protein
MAVLIDKNGLPYIFPENIIEEPSSTGILFDNLKSLAISLNSITGITRTNLGNVQSTIQNANSSFNVFAVTSHQINSENLVGVGTASGRITFTKENFAYNTSSSNRLSTGKEIVSMSGGINYLIPEIDGKKWMACAIYDGTTNGFRGILLWVFLNEIITSAGAVITGTGSVTKTSDIFFPSNFGSDRYRRIYQVVIGPGGGLSASNVTGNAGWIFSSSQNTNSNGYNATSRFSADDGTWAFVIGGKNNGEAVGQSTVPTYRTTNGYGFGNFNSTDSSSALYWNGVSVPTTNYVGFVFTGDA